MLSKCFLASSRDSFAASKPLPSPMTRAEDFDLPSKGKGGETTLSNLAAFWKASMVGLDVSIFEKHAKR